MGTNRVNILQSAPEGFYKAVEFINQFPAEILTELCLDVIAFLQYSKASIDIHCYSQKLLSKGIDSSDESTGAAKNALIFLFKSAAQQNLDTTQLSLELQESLAWKESSLEVIKKIWNEQGSNLSSVLSTKQLLHIGKLVEFQWKLGVAMSSDSCRNLNSPYVVIYLSVADPSGEITSRSFELAISEFKNFSRQIKEMTTVLETA